MNQDENKKIITNLVEQNKKLFEISSKLNGHYLKMDAELQTHFINDEKRFSKSEEEHEEFKDSLKEIKDSLADIKELSNFFKGAGLMKKPLMMILGFIVALVSVIGGIRTLISFFK